ncbi:hypothetical protein NEOKW01_1679 [Nematocida sp. AWRm80]|nr:hypothetical protein NEOKW01_1679 [Nematocida sp. AWRm80]
MKRVRSRRIENDKKLNVLYEKDLDQSRLQEYTGILFTTGVEKEEEEEHHLKQVIARREDSIPIPQTQKEKESIPKIKRRKKSIETTSTPIEEHPIDYLKDFGDVPKPEHTDLLTENEHTPTHLLPYICFRKREIKAQRKTRKPDLSLDKIKKIKIDLQTMKRLTELTIQRDTYYIQYLNTILSIFNVCREMNKRLDIGVLNMSESIVRDILFTKLISKNDLFFKKIPSFTNLYTCRKSISSLRKLLKTGPAPEESLVFTQREIDYLNAYNK